MENDTATDQPARKKIRVPYKDERTLHALYQCYWALRQAKFGSIPGPSISQEEHDQRIEQEFYDALGAASAVLHDSGAMPYGDVPPMAGVIQVRRMELRGWRMWIDGKEFPWLLGGEVKTNIARDEVPSVTVSILAERVQVDNEFPFSEKRALPTAWETPALEVSMVPPCCRQDPQSPAHSASEGAAGPAE